MVFRNRKSSSACIVLAGVLLGATTLAYPLTAWDSPTATYIGQTILDGGAPYRDAWNIKAPGIYFAFALRLLLFGAPDVGLRIFDLLWQTCTALVLGRIAARIFRSEAAAALAGLAYVVSYFSQNYWNFAQADGLLSLPLALSFLALMGALESDRWLLWGAAAAWLGVAAMFKLPMGFFGVFLALAALAQRPREPLAVVRRWATLALGVAAPVLLCGLYLFTKGAFAEFLRTQFVLAPEFVARLHRLVTFHCFRESATRPTMVVYYLMAGTGLAWLAFCVARKERLSLPVKLLLGWLTVGIATFVAHGAFLAYHYLPLLAPLAVLSAGAIHSLDEAAAKNGKTAWQKWAVRIFLVLALVIPAVKFWQHSAYAYRAWSGHQTANVWRDLGHSLRAKTAADNRILVWGNVPAIYVYAERKAATRFIHTYFLSIPWRGVDYRASFLAEFAASKPRFFVLIKEPTPEPCTGHEIGALEAYEHFPELKRAIETEYALEQEHEKYRVFRRKGLATEPGKAPAPER